MKKPIKNWFYENLWAIIIALISFTITFSLLNYRVSAIEKRNESTDPLIPRFIVTEEKVKEIDINIKEIKEDVKDIKNYLIK